MKIAVYLIGIILWQWLGAVALIIVAIPYIWIESHISKRSARRNDAKTD